MQSIVNEMVGSGGCSLLVRQWTPDNEAKGVLHILHGMGEHSLRYEDFADFLTEEGWVVYAHDHRQHGYSVCHDSHGILDDEDSWDDLVSDVEVVRKVIKEAYAHLPMVMLGHSMGSMILRSYLHSYEPDISGAIVMGSPYASSGAISTGRVLASVINRLNPKKRSNLMFRMMNDPLIGQIDSPDSTADWICTDMDVVDKYNEDPLCGYVYNAAFYREFCKGYLSVNDPEEMTGWPKVPTLIISGNDDPAGGMGKGPIVIQRRYRSYGIDCRLKLMEGMRHEILNESEKGLVFRSVVDFMNECL